MINGKQIAGIAIGSAIAASLATSVVLHNSDKIHRHHNKWRKKESEKNDK